MNEPKTYRTSDVNVQKRTHADTTLNKSNPEKALESLRERYPDSANFVRKSMEAISKKDLDYDSLKIFAQRLQYQMQEKSISHVDVAACLGVSRQVLEKALPEAWEEYDENSVHKSIDLRYLEAVSILLDVSPIYLIGWTENPNWYYDNERPLPEKAWNDKELETHLKTYCQKEWLTEDDCIQILSDRRRGNDKIDFVNNKIHIVIRQTLGFLHFCAYEKCQWSGQFTKDKAGNNQTIRYIEQPVMLFGSPETDKYIYELVKHVNEKNWELFYMILSIGTKPKKVVDSIAAELMEDADIRLFVNSKIERLQQGRNKWVSRKIIERLGRKRKKPKAKRLPRNELKARELPEESYTPYGGAQRMFPKDRFVSINERDLLYYLRYIIEPMIVWHLPDEIAPVTCLQFFSYIMKNNYISQKAIKTIRNSKTFAIRKRTTFGVGVEYDEVTKAITVGKAKLSKPDAKCLWHKYYYQSMRFLNAIDDLVKEDYAQIQIKGINKTGASAISGGSFVSVTTDEDTQNTVEMIDVDLSCFTLSAVRSMLNTIEANPLVFSTFSPGEIRKCRNIMEKQPGENDYFLTDIVSRFLETCEQLSQNKLKLYVLSSMSEVSDQLIELQNKNLQDVQPQKEETRKKKGNTQEVAKQKGKKKKEKERLSRARSIIEEEYQQYIQYMRLEMVASYVPTEDDPVEIKKDLLVALLLEVRGLSEWKTMKAYIAEFGIGGDEMEVLYANRLRLGPGPKGREAYCQLRVLALQHLIHGEPKTATVKVEDRKKKDGRCRLGEERWKVSILSPELPYYLSGENEFEF